MAMLTFIGAIIFGFLAARLIVMMVRDARKKSAARAADGMTADERVSAINAEAAARRAPDAGHLS